MMVTKNKILGVVSALGGMALLMLASCSKKEEEKAVEPNFSSLYENVFSDCGKCHAVGKADYASHPNLDFTSKSSAYSSMSKTQEDSNCASFKYAVAGNPGKSMAYAILTEETTTAFQEANGTACGIPAPNAHGISEYSSDKVAAVKKWIENGAKND